MNAFSLQQKEAVLVAFRISKLRELKNLGPWKLMENFLILVRFQSELCTVKFCRFNKLTVMY